MLCPSCKQEVTHGAKFCHFCGTRLHETDMSGDIVAVSSTVVKAGTVIMGEQNFARIQACPICGKYNDITLTFQCKSCKGNFICLTHHDTKFLVCTNCAKQMVLQSHPSTIALKDIVANGFDNGLAGWVIQMSRNGFITTSSCSIYSSEMIFEFSKTRTDFSFLTAPGANMENTFIEVQIVVKNFGDVTYKIPVCNTELTLKSKETMKVFRKYQYPLVYPGHPRIMFEEFDPVVLNLNGEDVSDKKMQVVTLKKESIANLYVAFQTNKGISDSQFLEAGYAIIINALSEVTGQNMALPLVFLHPSDRTIT
jgi:hypothetical protein